MTFHPVGNFIIPTGFHIFQRGRYTTSQTWVSLSLINPYESIGSKTYTQGDVNVGLLTPMKISINYSYIMLYHVISCSIMLYHVISTIKQHFLGTIPQPLQSVMLADVACETPLHFQVGDERWKKHGKNPMDLSQGPSKKKVMLDGKMTINIKNQKIQNKHNV